MVFAAAIRLTREGLTAAHGDWTATLVQETAFKTVVGYFPWYLVASLALALLVIRARRRGRSMGEA